MWAATLISEKLPKAYFYSLGEKLPNLVTLAVDDAKNHTDANRSFIWYIIDI
jgi:hypothetical protein